MEVFRKLVHVGRACGGEKRLVQDIRKSGGDREQACMVDAFPLIAVARCL